MKFYERYSKIISLIFLLLIFSIITILIKNYFKPFFVILIMLVCTHPIYRCINKLKFSKSTSAIISIFIVNISIFIIVFYFGNTLLSLFQKMYIRNTLEVDTFINNIKILLHFDLNKIIKTLSNVLSNSIVLQGAVTTGEGVLSYFIGNVSTYFILVDKEKIYNLLDVLLPQEIIKGIFSKKRNLKEVFKVELFLVLFSSFITIIGFKILGVPNSIFLGVLCAILDILPYVGTAIVFIPIIIYNILIKKYLLIIGLVALFLLIKITREILEAKFLSSKLDVHPLMVMLSIYIGVKMFGFVGILVGPIYCIIAKDIIYET
ncbi:AI-2E family transporter [Clostridium sp.]|uniref:AI-2E family transporter n=1 Tax=Clostridium sp. TaxID=1506 RepID=UPI003F388486